MKLVNREGHEVDLPDDDPAEINQYKARGYGPPEAVEANVALEQEQEAERTAQMDRETAEAQTEAETKAAAAAAAADAERQAAYDAEQEALGYKADKWTVDTLRDEIRTRNESRPEEQHLPVSGKKAELVEALEADDANPPAPPTSEVGNNPSGQPGSEDTPT